MTAAELAGGQNTSRKFRLMTIGVIAAVAIYTGGWFATAHYLESRLQQAFADGGANGLAVECDDLDIRGFPFRIGIFCDTVRFDDKTLASSASFGALRSAAQVYQPGHGVFELDGPAEFRSSTGIRVSADWSLMHASLRSGLSGMNRFSATYDQLKASVMLPLTGDRLDLDAAHGETHMRRNGPDLDVAASVDALDLRPDAGPSLLPPTRATVDLTLFDRADLADYRPMTGDALRGSKGELRDLTIDLGGGMVGNASGPFSINAEGLISGEFKVTIRQISKARPVLTAAFPDEDSTAAINNIANILRALNNGKDDATVTINVNKGRASLAFFPLGELPAL